MTETTQQPPLTRRRALGALLTFSIVSTVGGIILPIISYLMPRDTGAAYGGPTDVGKVESFAAGSGTVVSVQDRPVMVVNGQAGGLKAYSAICTHLGCIVAWDSNKKLIHCPCHDGRFNPLTGDVVSGPPPRGLAAYEVAVQGGRVLVGKPLGQLYGS